MTSAGVVLGVMESVRTSIKPHRPHPSHTPRGASRLTSPQVTALRADFAGALGSWPCAEMGVVETLHQRSTTSRDRAYVLAASRCERAFQPVRIPRRPGRRRPVGHPQGGGRVVGSRRRLSFVWGADRPGASADASAGSGRAGRRSARGVVAQASLRVYRIWLWEKNIRRAHQAGPGPGPVHGTAEGRGVGGGRLGWAGGPGGRLVLRGGVVDGPGGDQPRQPAGAAPGHRRASVSAGAVLPRPRHGEVVPV